MKDNILQRIRDETADLPLDELPARIGSFELNITASVDESSMEIFNYNSIARHCTVSALYDDSTHEYKIRIRLGLSERCLSKFFDRNPKIFFERFKAELNTTLERLDKNDSDTDSFISKLALNKWDYGNNLPNMICGFELFIKPSAPVEFTNGSFIIINYVDFAQARDLVICYNIFSDEFSAEARINGHTRVLYDFDSKTLPELEQVLDDKLEGCLARTLVTD